MQISSSFVVDVFFVVFFFCFFLFFFCFFFFFFLLLLRSTTKMIRITLKNGASGERDMLLQNRITVLSLPSPASVHGLPFSSTT